ncbi:ABC-type transport system periplasmic substrate-binding protein (probable substrate tungstate) [Natronomonas pharaonis DSM 2160]|uniref:ABC-type transport system periplasmic substrate-binding protein (Probable substrate tungstate) n=2 Tax=Natronomonas pharaonis TaxID=2257 RepID=Q3IQI5_NATPD|nr:substrate-binding domain-containing protein [Natronomonas pharaonis]CAI49611.1 ABC-type transport system periplasmic substrate-binding protein (probable substrate tungstate) [Natronomonas pharaonis DSM 2160]
MQRREFLAGGAGLTTAFTAGCADSDRANVGIADETLTLATTTSTYDTGLLDAVTLAFEDRYGVSVRTLDQGTGEALATGRRGDADVVMVHARSLEDEFIADGHGINRRDLMFNDFVVVGPDDDPAGIADLEDVTAAFATIAETASAFVSRGDNSGTHAKELAIWEAAEADPAGEWYREAGAGMGVVLNQANQTPAYALADRGTYIAQRSQLELSIQVEGPIEGGPELLANPYGVIAVNPAVHDAVNYDLAMAYIGFLTSPEGQAVIEEYTVAGEQLFFPRAVAEEPNFQQYVPEGWQPTEE